MELQITEMKLRMHKKCEEDLPDLENMISGIGKLIEISAEGNDIEITEGIEITMEKIDYESWRSCMESLGRHPITSMITRKSFGKLVELHNAIRLGDHENAARLSKELGFRDGKTRDVS